MCPDIDEQIALMIESYESSRGAQGDIQQALASAARARIAMEKANSLSEILGGALDNKIKLEVSTIFIFEKRRIIERNKKKLRFIIYDE